MHHSTPTTTKLLNLSLRNEHSLRYLSGLSLVDSTTYHVLKEFTYHLFRVREIFLMKGFSLRISWLRGLWSGWLRVGVGGGGELWVVVIAAFIVYLWNIILPSLATEIPKPNSPGLNSSDWMKATTNAAKEQAGYQVIHVTTTFNLTLNQEGAAN